MHSVTLSGPSASPHWRSLPLNTEPAVLPAQELPGPSRSILVPVTGKRFPVSCWYNPFMKVLCTSRYPSFYFREDTSN